MDRFYAHIIATNCESSSKKEFLGKIYYAFCNGKIKLLIDDDVGLIIHGINSFDIISDFKVLKLIFGDENRTWLCSTDARH